MPQLTRQIVFGVLVAAALPLALATADDSPPKPPQGDRRHPPGPPPEAVEACKTLTEGTACTVTFGEHTVNGTCEKGPDGNATLACRPAGGPPPPPR